MISDFNRSHRHYGNRSRRQIAAAFWLLGLLNNTPYVIMLAAAKNISQGGTGLVFLANVVPEVVIKVTAPYWFDKVSYHARMMMGAIWMAVGFSMVAFFSGNVMLQLVGVGFASAQGALGGASLLALGGKYDAGRKKNVSLTCFSSGTGLAGVFGYFWKICLVNWIGLSLETSLWLANTLALAYGGIYACFLWDDDNDLDELRDHTLHSDEENFGCEEVEQDADSYEMEKNETSSLLEKEGKGDEKVIEMVTPVSDMSFWQRFRLVMSLWKYMIPLFVVYATQYSLQAGTWTAIGFPVTSLQARNHFYEYGNWMYQFGVFFSRSSGTIFEASMSILWIMPLLQCMNVAFFWWVAATQVSWLYNDFLYLPAFYVGLLGGGVYINGYTRICTDLPLAHREFALSATSVAEGLGIAMADVVGLFLQSCLYQMYDIQGAVVSCPWS